MWVELGAIPTSSPLTLGDPCYFKNGMQENKACYTFSFDPNIEANAKVYVYYENNVPLTMVVWLVNRNTNFINNRFASLYHDPSRWNAYNGHKEVARIGVDSGQIVVADSTLIWSENKNVDFYSPVFEVSERINFIQRSVNSPTWNEYVENSPDKDELNRIGKLLADTLSSVVFSDAMFRSDYDYACAATLNTQLGAGALENRIIESPKVYETHASAYATRTAHGDGTYSVYAVTLDAKRICNYVDEKYTGGDILVGVVVELDYNEDDYVDDDFDSYEDDEE